MMWTKWDKAMILGLHLPYRSNLDPKKDLAKKVWGVQLRTVKEAKVSRMALG